jgi:hypothetical protein
LLSFLSDIYAICFNLSSFPSRRTAYLPSLVTSIANTSREFASVSNISKGQIASDKTTPDSGVNGHQECLGKVKLQGRQTAVSATAPSVVPRAFTIHHPVAKSEIAETLSILSPVNFETTQADIIVGIPKKIVVVPAKTPCFNNPTTHTRLVTYVPSSATGSSMPGGFSRISSRICAATLDPTPLAKS